MPILGEEVFQSIRSAFANHFLELRWQAENFNIDNRSNKIQCINNVFTALILYISQDKINCFEHDIKEKLVGCLEKCNKLNSNKMPYLKDVLGAMYLGHRDYATDFSFEDDLLENQLKIKQVINLLCIQDLSIEQAAIIASVERYSIRNYFSLGKRLFARLAGSINQEKVLLRVIEMKLGASDNNTLETILQKALFTPGQFQDFRINHQRVHFEEMFTFYTAGLLIILCNEFTKEEIKNTCGTALLKLIKDKSYSDLVDFSRHVFRKFHSCLRRDITSILKKRLSSLNYLYKHFIVSEDIRRVLSQKDVSSQVFLKAWKDFDNIHQLLQKPRLTKHVPVLIEVVNGCLEKHNDLVDQYKKEMKPLAAWASENLFSK